MSREIRLSAMGCPRFHDGVVDLSMTKDVKPRYADDAAADLTTEFDQFPLAQVADVRARVLCLDALIDMLWRLMVIEERVLWPGRKV